MRIQFFRNVIDRVESQQSSWFSIALTLFSVIFLRNFLEGILEEAHTITLLEGVYHSLLINFVHFFSFYLTIFLLIMILLAYITRERFAKVARSVSLFSPIILVAPIADMFISRGAGFNLSYPTELNDLIRLLLAGPFYRGSIVGITPGMRIESIIAALLVFLYVLGKGKGILRAAVSVIALDLVVIVVANIPLIMALAFGKPFTFLYQPGSLLSSDTQKFGVIYLLLLAFALLFAGLAFLPRFTRIALKSIRFLRAFNYVGAVIFGFLIGYAIAGKFTPFLFDNPWDFLALSSLCIAIFLAFCGAVVINDIFDEQSDAISRRRNPLVSHKIPRNQYLMLGLLFHGLALLFAINTSYTAFFLVFISIPISFFYSSPPFRLKRLPIVSTFVIAFATLCSVILGFSIFAGPKAFFAFPSKLTLLFLVSLTFGFTPKDLVDVEGDRKSRTYTLPVIFGEKAGKIITYVLVCIGYLLVPLLFRSPLMLMLALIFIIVTGLQFLLRRIFESLFLATYYLFSLCVILFLFFQPEMLMDDSTAEMKRRFQIEQHFERRHYQDVIAVGSQSSHIRDPRSIALMGFSAFRIGDLEKSIKYLQSALIAIPHEAEIYTYLSNALIKTDTGNVGAARVNNLALRRWLDNKRFLAQKGIIEFHSGNSKSAYQFLQIARKLGHDETSLYLYLARTLRSMGEDTASETLLLKSLARKDNDASVLAELAKLKMDAQEYDQAIAFLNRAIGDAEHSPLLYNNMGVCYLRRNDPEKAIQFFQKALQINANYTPARRNLEMLLGTESDPEQTESPFP